MKVITTGSRDWINSMTIYHRLRKFPRKTKIIHGAAKYGADSIVDEISRVLEFKVEKYPARWDLYGKSAGPIRNREMIDQNRDADLLIAFWDGTSKGTANTIKLAMKADIPVEIHYKDGKVMYPEGITEKEGAKDE